jgi:hypothetical protein
LSKLTISHSFLNLKTGSRGFEVHIVYRVLHGTLSPKTALYTGRTHNKSVYAVDPCLEFSLEPLAAGHLTLLLPLLRPYLQQTMKNYRIYIKYFD